MSQAQYNLHTKTDYLNRKMFLDPAGPVTIQRFEEVKYNKIVKFEQEARGFFWVPERLYGVYDRKSLESIFYCPFNSVSFPSTPSSPDSTLLTLLPSANW